MKNCLIKNCEKGFTLMELLLVMALIAVFSTFIISASLNPTQKSRDTRRRSDLNQYRTAIENYSIKKNGVYPSFISPVDLSGTFCSTTIGTTYLSSCPQDPYQSHDASFFYRYQSNGTGSPNIDATKYILWSKLEKTGSGTSGFWYICSNGVSQELSVQPVAGDCGF